MEIHFLEGSSPRYKGKATKFLAYVWIWLYGFSVAHKFLPKPFLAYVVPAIGKGIEIWYLDFSFRS